MFSVWPTISYLMPTATMSAKAAGHLLRGGARRYFLVMVWKK
jgi:hypothetical protein